MNYYIKDQIQKIKIDEEEFTICELGFSGLLPVGYYKTREEFEIKNRYGTMKTSEIYSTENSLGDWLTSSTIAGAIENRKDANEFKKILEKYEYDYNNPVCVEEIRSYINNRRSK